MRRSANVVRTTSVLACLAACATTLSAGSQAGAVQAVQDTLTVYGERPVKEAIAVLERRYGWIVTYEDPPYLYAGDVEDVTKMPLDGQRALSPRARRLELPQPLPAPSEHPDPVSVVDAVLDADWETTTGQTGFRVFQSTYGLHVVPTRSRNVAGESTDVRPILDTRITLVGGGVSAYRLLEMFCAALAEATGTPIVLATVPRDLLQTRTVTLDANNEPARQVLIRLLHKLGVPLTWHLYYSPSPPQGFYLNIVSPG